jgi:aminoglycoside phosphotransferase (APT) family kinase protein
VAGSLEAAGLVEALRACGLVGPDERARLAPLTGGVSSDVFRVETEDGRTLVVKRSIPQLRVKEEWLAPVERMASEVRWLRLARSIDPRLAPEVLAVLPEAHVFVMAFLDPANHPVWKDEMATGRVDPAFAAWVGADLARIHASTAGRADIAADFDTYDFFFALRVSPFLLFTAERHPDVAPKLRALADDLGRRRIALMHGDVSPKNILVGPDGPVFLDAETTAYGDPAFDLAFCLTHLLLKTVWLRPHREAVMASFDALRGAYARGLSWEPPEGLSARTAALVAALLLARVDGKSPAPYLTADPDKDFVRRSAMALLTVPDLNLVSLAARWRREAVG